MCCCNYVKFPNVGWKRHSNSHSDSYLVHSPWRTLKSHCMRAHVLLHISLPDWNGVVLPLCRICVIYGLHTNKWRTHSGSPFLKCWWNLPFLFPTGWWVSVTPHCALRLLLCAVHALITVSPHSPHSKYLPSNTARSFPRMDGRCTTPSPNTKDRYFEASRSSLTMISMTQGACSHMSHASHWRAYPTRAGG